MDLPVVPKEQQRKGKNHPEDAKPASLASIVLGAVAVGAARGAFGSRGRWNRIPAAGRPRMASANAPDAQPEAAPGAVTFDCFNRVRRASRGEAALPAYPWTQEEPVEPDGGDEQCFENHRAIRSK
ncbi:hypothetical protein G6F65_022598 [Rhizopus arrhizus]|nr:hypothetical protein G6F65_022598 [Rhizopus arrhizus]